MLDYPLADVMELIRQHLDKMRRSGQQAPVTTGPLPPRNEPKVIYRKASDDWL